MSEQSGDQCQDNQRILGEFRKNKLYVVAKTTFGILAGRKVVAHDLIIESAPASSKGQQNQQKCQQRPGEQPAQI